VTHGVNCKHCYDEVVMSTHVVPDCSEAVWCVFVHPGKRSAFFGSNLKDWVTLNLRDSFNHDL